MTKMAYNARVNGAVVEEITGTAGKRTATARGTIDRPDVKTILAWHPTTIEGVKNDIAAQGFKRDSIVIENAFPGQYEIGIEYNFTAVLDIDQKHIEKILEKNAEAKKVNAEINKLTRQIKKMTKENAGVQDIEKLKKQRQKLAPNRFWR